MKITSKYEIGNHIWYVYERDGEVCVYDDYIVEIAVNKNGIYYLVNEGNYESVYEKDVISYGDSDKLYMKICDLMDQIRESEES